MSRVAAVQADSVERHRLTPPRVVGGVEHLPSVLIPDGEDATQIVGKGKIASHDSVLLDHYGVAVKIVIPAVLAILLYLLVLPGIDGCPDPLSVSQ